jgi:glycosidase
MARLGAHTFIRFILVNLLVAACVVGTPAAPQLAVTSVDPPSWWVGHSWSPVQVLVRGTGLAGAKLVSTTPGVTVERQRVNDSGTYLLAYARIDERARPGRASFRVEAPGGAATASLDLLPPVASDGRFRGLDTTDVVYLIMPDRFADGDPSNNGETVAEGLPVRSRPRGYHGGDLKGITKRLPYLKDLGVTTVWFTPIYDNDDAEADYHGYHATDFYAVEERFGTMADLRDLVETAHRLGMKVMQDQVANHTGPTHPWIEGPPTPTWFNGTPESHLDNPYKIESIVKPGADPEVRRATLEGWFANRLPDLNQNDPDAAHYLIQNSLWWIGTTGIDAIRQDTLPYAPRSYWAAWTKAVEAEFPRFTMLGEVFGYTPEAVSFFQGGVARDGIDTGVDQLFDFPLGFALVGYFSRRGTADEVAKVLSADALYPNTSALVPFVGNHDTQRAITLLNGDPRALRLAHVAVMTMRGIPQIYYGDEIGIPGGGDPDNRRDFPGGFAGDPSNAFTAAGRTEQQRVTFENLKRMLALRKAHPALRAGTTRVLVARGPILAYLREAEGERAVVAFNSSDVEVPVEVDLAGVLPDGATLADALSSNMVPTRGGKATFRLGPQSAVVLFPR